MQKRFTTITWLLLGIVSLFIVACKPITPPASPQAQSATTVASIITRESGGYTTGHCRASAQFL